MRALKLLPLIAIILINYSCSNIPFATSENPHFIGQSQEQIDKKYVESFDPTYKIGMAYTYSITNSNTLNQAPEISMTEILDISDDIIKIRFTSNTKGIQEKSGKITDFDSDIPDTGIISEGTEDVIVPAGTYNGATKISFFMSIGQEGTPKIKTTIWLVKNIGAIKRVDILPNATIITTELKDFKN